MEDWATHDANGFPLIYPGPSGEPIREGRVLTTEEYLRMTNPEWVARARAEHLAATQAERDARWAAWLAEHPDWLG